MVRVIATQHSEYFDHRSGVKFESAILPTADGKGMRRVGVAEMDAAKAKEFFADHPLFEVEGLAPTAPGNEARPLGELTKKELQARAAALGLTIEGKANKAELIAAIAEAEAQAPEDADDDDEGRGA